MYSAIYIFTWLSQPFTCYMYMYIRCIFTVITCVSCVKVVYLCNSSSVDIFMVCIVVVVVDTVNECYKDGGGD